MWFTVSGGILTAMMTFLFISIFKYSCNVTVTTLLNFSAEINYFVISKKLNVLFKLLKSITNSQRSINCFK